jgi:hypothetical protein
MSNPYTWVGVIAATAYALRPLTQMVVALFALRGTKPRDRAAILRELRRDNAALPMPRRKSTAPDDDSRPTQSA